MDNHIKGKLEELIKLAGETISKSEILTAFQKITDYVKRIDQRNIDEIKSMHQSLTSLASQIDSKAGMNIGSAKQEVIDQCMAEMKSMVDSHDKMMADAQAKIDEVQDGAAGQDADEQAIATNVIEAVQQPVLDKLEADIPKLGNSIRDALELLQDSDRLDASAIKGLREELVSLRGMIGNKGVVYVPNGGGGGGHTVLATDLSSQLNGVLTSFSLPSFWKIISVQLSSAPVLRPTTDWTSDSSNHTISFTSEIPADTLLASGQSLLVTYSI